MHLFKESREPFLGFLRNLTPQALILSCALVAGYKIRPPYCCLENVMPIVIFFCLLILWFAATLANLLFFIESSYQLKRLNRASKLLVGLGITGFGHFRALLSYSLRKQRMIFVEVPIAFIVVLFGLVVSMISAIGAATTLSKLINS